MRLVILAIDDNDCDDHIVVQHVGHDASLHIKQNHHNCTGSGNIAWA